MAEVETTERETLAAELERVIWLGLQKLEQILRCLTDPGDGNLLSAQTAVAGLAVNAQLRADAARDHGAGNRDDEGGESEAGRMGSADGRRRASLMPAQSVNDRT